MLKNNPSTFAVARLFFSGLQGSQCSEITQVWITLYHGSKRFQRIFCWWSWTYACIYFRRDKSIAQKHMFCNLGARWRFAFLNVSHHVLSIDEGLCGTNLWRSSANIQQGPAPWILFLTPLAPLQVTVFVGEAEHMCLYPFARKNASSALLAFHVFFTSRNVYNLWTGAPGKNEQRGRKYDCPNLNRHGWGFLIADRNPATCVQKSTGIDSCSDIWPM